MPKTETQLMDEYFRKFGDEIYENGDEEDIKEYEAWLKSKGEGVSGKVKDTGPINRF